MVTFFKTLWKDVSKQPGWGYLLVTYTFLVWILPDICILDPITDPHCNISLQASPTLTVLLLTGITYLIGDALDKAIFNNYTRPQHSINSREQALADLDIKKGSYGVSLALLKAAGKYNGLIPIYNELAKFLRSFAVFVFFILFLPSQTLKVIWPTTYSSGVKFGAFLITFILLWLYIQFKGIHITKLYFERKKLVLNDKGFNFLWYEPHLKQWTKRLLHFISLGLDWLINLIKIPKLIESIKKILEIKDDDEKKEKKYNEADLELSNYNEKNRVYFWDGKLVIGAKNGNSDSTFRSTKVELLMSRYRFCNGGSFI